MKAALKVGELKRFLRAAGLVAGKVKGNPILGCIRIQMGGADDRAVVLTATSLDVEVREKFAQVEPFGQYKAVCVPIKALQDSVRKSKALLVDLDVLDGNGLSVELDGVRQEIHGMDPQDFQMYQADPDVVPGPIQSVSVSDLEWIEKAACRDKTRYNLNGFFVGEDCLVSTDGHRLHQVKHRAYADHGFTVPLVVAELGRKLGRAYQSEVMDLKRRGCVVGFRLGTLVGTARLLDGVFPKYQEVIPAEGSGKYVLKIGASAIPVLDRADTATGRTWGAKFGINRHGCKVSVDNPDTGRFEADLPVWLEKIDEAKDLVVGYNCQYLIEALGGVWDGVMEIEDELSPARIYNDETGRLAVVMPMRV